MSDIELIKSRLVGANLKRLLKSKEITKWRLSKDCGITYRTIINWQAGKSRPCNELALRAAEYLGLLSRNKSEIIDDIIEIKKEINGLQKRIDRLTKELKGEE